MMNDNEYNMNRKYSCYTTSTRGCNNNSIFQKDYMFTFPTVDVSRARWSGSGRALVIHAKMATLLNSLFFVFTISLLTNNNLKYYDYIVKWHIRLVSNWCASLDIA